VDLKTGQAMNIMLDIDELSIPCFFNETHFIVQVREHNQSTVTVWDWTHKSIINQFEFVSNGGPHAWGFQVDSAGNMVNISTCQKCLEVRDIGSGRILHQFEAHEVDTVALCVCGSTWLTLGLDHHSGVMIKLWSDEGLQLCAILPEQNTQFSLGIPYFLRFDGAKRIYYNDDAGLYFFDLPLTSLMNQTSIPVSTVGSINSNQDQQNGVMFNESRTF
jgi:hypothetical protein